MGKTVKTAQHSATFEDGLSTLSLTAHISDWLNDSRIRQLSKQTIAGRELFGKNLFWFLKHIGHETCGACQLRDFLAYLGVAHTDPIGRWGNKSKTFPLRPITIRTYYTQCRVLFNWLVEEGIVDESPMSRIRPPRVQADQIRPFNLGQVEALLAEARRSKHPKRDEAMLLLLHDTGMRASELCSLKMCDLDLNTQSCSVLGKGNKKRTLYVGRVTTQALYQFLRVCPREPQENLFVSDRGLRAGEALTRSGLLQLVERLGKSAGIRATRRSPHTFRHTFAVEFLRNGGNVFSLQHLLGHSNIQMTNRYV